MTIALRSARVTPPRRVPTMAVVAGVLATGAAVLAAVVARSGAPFSLAPDPGVLAIEVGAAVALAASGALALWRGRRAGWMLAAVAALWVVREWANPAAPSAVVFTVGLAAGEIWVAMLGCAAIAFPFARIARPARVAVAVSFVAILAPRSLAVATYDPAAEGCPGCPANLLLVTDDARVATAAETASTTAVGAAAALLLITAVVGAVRSSRAITAVRAPIVAAGGAVLLVVIAGAAAAVMGGPDRVVQRELVGVTAAGLVLFAVSCSWDMIRLAGARRRVGRLVGDLSAAPAPGRLRDELAAITRDGSVELMFPLGDRVIDGSGRVVPDPRRAAGLDEDRRVTAVIGDDARTIALIAHRAGALDDAAFRDSVARLCALVVEHERVQAELAERVSSLRASRRALVERIDHERRRMERDLHDGAQQRLVALLLELRVERARRADGRIDAAIAEVEAALDELRGIAHGLYPPSLAEGGLGAALEWLRESAAIPVSLGPTPAGRYPAAVESTAYLVVAETVRRAGLARARIAVIQRGEELEVSIAGMSDTNHPPRADVGGRIMDRIGAIGGELAIDAADGSVEVRAVLPCVS